VQVSRGLSSSEFEADSVANEEERRYLFSPASKQSPAPSLSSPSKWFGHGTPAVGQGPTGVYGYPSVVSAATASRAPSSLQRPPE